MATENNVLRAQPVDATPSSELIRQHFPMEKRLSDCNPNQTLARMVFRLNRRSRTALSNGGPCKWILALSCVDPLNPPPYNIALDVIGMVLSGNLVGIAGSVAPGR
jgi:hypothetical protein